MGEADLGERPEAEVWMHQYLKVSSIKEQTLSGQLKELGFWEISELGSVNLRVVRKQT